jgi:MFS family permease
MSQEAASTGGTTAVGPDERPATWKVMTVLIIAEICAASCLSMPLPALSAWLHIYGSAIAVGWIMSSFLLVSAATAALCGSLGDLFGRKRVIMAILVTVLVGSVISASTETLGWVIAGRCLQGVSGAVLPLALGLSREVLPPHRVSVGFGIIIASASGASALGFPIAGFLTDHYGPSSIFWALGLFAILGLIGIGAVLPDIRRPTAADHRIDWLGGVLFAPAVALILLAVSGSRQGGWMASLTWPMFAAGIALIIFWYIHERRHNAPLIDVRLLANGYCFMALILTALLAVGAFQITETASLLLQQPAWTGAGLALSATATGLLKLPATGAGSLSSIATGWLAGRWGPWPCVLVGGIVICFAAVCAMLFHSSVLSIIVLVLMVMVGLTAVYTCVPVLLALGTPAERTSEAMGMMAVVRAIFQGVGAQMVAVILASWVVVSPSGVHFPSELGYSIVFGYMSVTAVPVILIALAMLWRRPAARATNAAASLRPAGELSSGSKPVRSERRPDEQATLQGRESPAS